MIPRDYEQIEVILEPERFLKCAGLIPIMDIDCVHTRYKWKFFKQLERQVYRSKGLAAITPDGFRQFNDLPILNKNIPYWEIHYYPRGFVNPMKSEQPPSAFFDKDYYEQHFYFTLKSFITDDYRIIQGSQPFINAGHSECKVDQDFTGRTIDQENYGINIVVLDDNKQEDSFKYLKTFIPGDIWNCFLKEGKAPQYKPSELPQMMFLSHGSSFDAKTEDIKSIVCMDRFTHLGTTEKDVTLKIKGNTFLNEGAIISPTRYGDKNSDSYLGKNTIFGQNCNIHSLYIEDSVVVASEVSADFNTVLSSGCILTEGTKVTRYQKILAGQKVTAKTPLFLSALKTDLEDFLLKFKARTPNPT